MVISAPSSLHTPRLCLVPLAEVHIPALIEARKESFHALKRWDIFMPEKAPEEINPTDEAIMVAARIDRHQKGESLFYVLTLRDSGHFLGIVSLTSCDWVEKTAMLGFWLRTSATGHGYAHEAAQTLIRYGKNQGLSLYSRHEQGNEKSQKTLLSLGFQEVGCDAHGFLTYRLGHNYA